jgi:polyisoprenoid-binding protein YceI
MMPICAALLLSVLSAVPVPSAPSPAEVVWTADSQSSVTLSVSRFLGAKITGTIPIQSARVVTSGGAAAPLSVSATLDAAQLDTHDPQRDAQLRGGEFFDAALYPTISFTSERVTATGPDAFTIDGRLTMRGVTHDLQLDGHFAGLRTDAEGKQHATYEATGSFHRSDYGMTYARPIVSNNVQLNVNIEAVPAPATPTPSRPAPAAS